MTKDQKVTEAPEEEASSRVIHFEARNVTKLPPVDGKRTDYRDSIERGLTLRVSPSGERGFAFVYRSQGRVRRFTLKAGITLAAARERVRALRADVGRGVDPQSLKTEERVLAKRNAVAPRFASLCDEFVRDQSPGWRPSTKLAWLHHIDSNIKPALGNKLPGEVTGDDVRTLIDTMANGITDGREPDGTVRWKRRPVPTSARRCFEVLRRVFAWAVWRRLVPMSPCISARPFETSRRSGSRRASRRFKPYSDEQLRAIFSAVKGTELEHVLNLIARTGVRRHEALAARWEDVDSAKGLWRVPAEMHKVGEETGAPHLVTLSKGALGILTAARAASLKEGKRSPWVFPADTTTCYVCEQAGHADPANKAAKKVKDAAGIEDRGLLHRFRDTLKTRLSEHGIDSRVSEHILGHVVPGIAGVYDHAELLSQRREALDWWDGELARILKTEPKTERTVMPVAARA